MPADAVVSQSWLSAEGGPHGGRDVLVDAATTSPRGRRRDSLTLGVFEPTTGTPFTQVSHILTTYGRRALFVTTSTTGSAPPR